MPLCQRLYWRPPLTKKPEHSGYEIGFKENNVGLLLQSSCDFTFSRNTQLIRPDASQLILLSIILECFLRLDLISTSTNKLNVCSTSMAWHISCRNSARMSLSLGSSVSAVRSSSSHPVMVSALTCGDV